MTRKLRAVDAILAAEGVLLLVFLCRPAFRAEGVRQRVSRARTEIQTVANAAASVRSRTGSWPDDGAPGRMPESMKSDLPAGFRFDRENYRLDWDHWGLSDGPEPGDRRGEFAGVSVDVSDPDLRHALVGSLGKGRVHFTVGDRVTFVLSDSTSLRP